MYSILSVGREKSVEAHHCDCEEKPDGDHDEIKIHQMLGRMCLHIVIALEIDHCEQGKERHGGGYCQDAHTRTNLLLRSPLRIGLPCFSAPPRSPHEPRAHVRHRH